MEPSTQAGGEVGEQTPNYYSFLLRLWRTGEGHPWHASLEAPQSGERLGFESLEALFAFLREQIVPCSELAGPDPDQV